jgi:hypothetical protein
MMEAASTSETSVNFYQTTQKTAIWRSTVHPPDAWVNMEQQWNDFDRGNRRTRRKTFPSATCPPQISYRLSWTRCRVSAVRRRRLTAWGMTWSNMSPHTVLFRLPLFIDYGHSTKMFHPAVMSFYISSLIHDMDESPPWEVNKSLS